MRGGASRYAPLSVAVRDLGWVCVSSVAAGGVPNDRRLDRHERPATAPAPSFFDAGPDWAARWVDDKAARPEYHNEDHFVEVYAWELVRLMRGRGGGVPSQERAWKDVKIHGGKRGEFRGVLRMCSGGDARSRDRRIARRVRERMHGCAWVTLRGCRLEV